MIDLKHAEERFKDHVAILRQFDTISVLDFKRPGSNEYRIRFLFENDYCRLHISGDLGELSAVNYNNMVIGKFYKGFVFDPGYFEGKVTSHARALYSWDEDDAREDLRQILAERLEEDYESVEETIDELLEDFADPGGLATGNSAVRDILYDIDSNWWEWAGGVGKRRTGIIELYLLAFRLAWEQLEAAKEGGPK